MSKATWANTITSLDKRLPAGMSDCYSFGMTWGCQEDCPQLQREECEIYKDVEDFIEQQIKTKGDM